MEVDWRTPQPAEPFGDPYPPQRPSPAPEAGPDRPYRPLPAPLPRFSSPYLPFAGDELRYGPLTAGGDPLLQAGSGLAGCGGSDTGRASGQALYRSDRARPTLQLVLEDETRPARQGRLRTRKAEARVSLPLRRTRRSSQSASLAWRRER